MTNTKTIDNNWQICQDVGMWQIFVRWWCSLVVFVAGVRVVEFGSYGVSAFNCVALLVQLSVI